MGNVRGGIFNKEWGKYIKTGIFRDNSQNVTHIISSFKKSFAMKYFIRILS